MAMATSRANESNCKAVAQASGSGFPGSQARPCTSLRWPWLLPPIFKCIPTGPITQEITVGSLFPCSADTWSCSREKTQSSLLPCTYKQKPLGSMVIKSDIDDCIGDQQYIHYRRLSCLSRTKAPSFLLLRRKLNRSKLGWKKNLKKNLYTKGTSWSMWNTGISGISMHDMTLIREPLVMHE